MTGRIGVIPNASDVYAIVKGKQGDKKSKDLAHVKLQVISADDYKGMPNFLKGEVGKDIDIVVAHDDLDFFDDRVNVLISLAGDERQQFYTARVKPRE